jgi:hypothetical protein
MSLPQYILAISLSLLILAGLLAALAKPFLKSEVRLADAALATILMATLGAFFALLLARAYTPFRPTFSGALANKYQLMGWWIEVDIAAIWILGLAVGYAFALALVLRKQVPTIARLGGLSFLTALISPAILFGAEFCLKSDPTQILAAFN